MKVFRVILWSLWTACVVGLVWLWIRSYSMSDGVLRCDGKGNETHVYVCQGRLIWRTLHFDQFKTQIDKVYQFDVLDAETNFYMQSLLPSNQTFLKNWILIRYGTYLDDVPVDAGPDVLGAVALAVGEWYEIQLWAVLAILMLPVVTVGVRTLRRRSKLMNLLCTTCGYDLRAHKPGDKCPECGTPVPAMEASKASQS
jgi:hypothetical protein